MDTALLAQLGSERREAITRARKNCVVVAVANRNIETLRCRARFELDPAHAPYRQHSRVRRRAIIHRLRACRSRLDHVAGRQRSGNPIGRKFAHTVARHQSGTDLLLAQRLADDQRVETNEWLRMTVAETLERITGDVDCIPLQVLTQARCVYRERRIGE